MIHVLLYSTIDNVIMTCYNITVYKYIYVLENSKKYIFFVKQYKRYILSANSDI